MVHTFRQWLLLLLCGLLALPAAAAPEAAPVDANAPSRTPVYTCRVVGTFPHDRGAFTQGFTYDGGVFYEGTGLYGRSTLRKVDPATGRVLRQIPLAPGQFGEGIAVWDRRIVQVTWRDEAGFVYDRDSFRRLSTFTYPHEGWGITHDSRNWIMSDGTAVLHWLDRRDFHETGRLTVFDERGPVAGLNELEYVKGLLYANVWPTASIAVIDPRTGRVRSWIDLQGLLPPWEAESVDVANGIAYDARADRLFVTGKLWPAVFEIRLVRKP